MFLNYNLFTFCWAGIILALTVSSGSIHSNMGNQGTDKVIHTFIFMVLTLLMIVGFRKQHKFNKLRTNAVLSTIVICSLYGFLIELIQLFLPYRSVEFADILADLVGIGIGYIMYFMVYKFSFKW